MGMKIYDYIAIVLLAVGGINWPLNAWFRINLVKFLPVIIQHLVYGAIGISGLYALIFLLKR